MHLCGEDPQGPRGEAGGGSLTGTPEPPGFGTQPEASDSDPLASRGAPPPQGAGGSSRSGERGLARAPAVAVTRPDEDNRLRDRLRTAGFIPIHTPLTRILPPSDGAPLEAAVRRLAGRPRGGTSLGEASEVEASRVGFDVLLLTSRQAIPPVTERLHALGLTPPFRIPDTEIWVVGSATGAAAAAAGLAPTRVPGRYVAEALLEEARDWRDLEGLRILFVRAESGREILPDGLRAAGAEVTLVAGYRTVSDPEGADRLVARVRATAVDVVPLTAGSGAAALAEAWTRAGTEVEGQPEPWPEEIPIVAIGPATQERAEALGLPVRVTAEPHTLDGLVAAIRGLLT